MGWYEYFTRRGFPTYLGEQSGRARSGFNGTIYNDVKKGCSRSPRSHRCCWAPRSSLERFRFGPSFGAVGPTSSSRWITSASSTSRSYRT